MVKEMQAVMGRINDIRKRFGLMRHNDAAPQQKPAVSFKKVLNETQTAKVPAADFSQAHTKNEINGLIDRYAALNRVSPRLVKAVVEQESSYNSRAVSPKGARGLMQLMPQIIRESNVKDPFAPDENLQAGISHLKSLLTRYNGDYRKALAAYNAGPAAVDRHGGVPEYKETQEYVKKVIARYMENR